MTRLRIVRSIAMGTALAMASTSALVSSPAHAQFGGIVYDPSNYAQNVLTAARTLEQINNQIRMLQNQADSLINEARNLQSLPLTLVQPLQDQIRQTQHVSQLVRDHRQQIDLFARHAVRRRPWPNHPQCQAKWEPPTNQCRSLC